MSFFDRLYHLGYSHDLHQQLKGLSTNCTGYTGDAVYQFTSFILVAVSFIIMLNYYYGLFNNPRFTHRRVWLVNILVAMVITGVVAYLQAISFLPEEKHCPDLHFNALDCALFAFTEMIYTGITCILISLLLKWKSISNKKIPF